jgi:hypothetical protein
MKKVILILGLLASSAKAQYINPDKQMHIAAGAMIGTICYTKGFELLKQNNVKNPYMKAVGISFGTSLAVAATKEYLDYKKHKQNNTWNYIAKNDRDGDIVSTVLGAVSISIVIDLFNKK